MITIKIAQYVEEENEALRLQEMKLYAAYTE